MLPALVRTCATAGVLALATVFAAASPAMAAEASIVLDTDDGRAFAYEPLDASGTCDDGSLTAVVTAVQGDVVLDQVAVDVVDDAWAVTLDVSDGESDFASVGVDCLLYADGDPLGSASDDVFLDNFRLIDVTVSPDRIRIGQQFTATAACLPGTTVAEIRVASIDPDAQSGNEPPLLATLTPAADGQVSFTGTLTPRSDLVAGPGRVVVTCGTDGEVFGFADITLLAAAGANGNGNGNGNGSAELALTGAATAPLTGAAVLTILVGLLLMLAGFGLPKRLRRTTA